MLLLPFFILFMVVGQPNGQINFQSDIDLSSLGTQFQPANPIEIISTDIVATFADCGQLCNQNVECRTFDYDSYSMICQLFEGAIGTGSIVPSGSVTARVGSVRLQPSFFVAFGQPCAQCANTRYLVCSPNSNDTCQCPTNTFWNGVQCENQGYENANCSNDQWCREDIGLNCSNLHFCTEYHCGNMTIAKADLPGYDLSSKYTSNFSMCCSWCQSYSGCQAFTWISAPGMFYGMCYLKWSSGGGLNPYNDHISAYY